jgi:hypothetical protein
LTTLPGLAGWRGEPLLDDNDDLYIEFFVRQEGSRIRITVSCSSYGIRKFLCGDSREPRVNITGHWRLKSPANAHRPFSFM